MFIVFTGFISLLIVQGLPVNPDSITTWIYLILISICGCIGQTTVSKGAQLISPLKTSVILFKRSDETPTDSGLTTLNLWAEATL